MVLSSLRVTIDSLALGGFDPAERRAFSQSLQSELARILSSPAARSELAGPRRTPVLKLNRMPLQPGVPGARRLARDVAKAIARGARS